MGARGGTRTRKPLRAMDFESIEFADFSTRAGAEKGSGMRSEAEVRLALELVANGLNDCEISRQVGIPRGTIRQWRVGQTPNFRRRSGTCAVCSGDPRALPLPSYTYLLGLYLGDGCLTACPRAVFKLRIACAERYPELIRYCELAISEVLPNKVGRTRKTNERCWKSTRTPSTGRACFPSTDPGASTNGRSSWPPGSRNWSTATRDRWSGGCSTPTGAGC